MSNSSKSSRVIIIAGMHRSGTSLTAGLLQTAGLNVGEDLLPAAADNRHGFFEDKDFEEFQDGVLQKRGMNYLVTSQEPITLNRDEKEAARKLVSAREQLPLWGWKDPRTTLFLDFWNDELPQARFLFVYRHPVEVVFSLLRRGGPKVFRNPARLFQVWELYNLRVLDFMRRHPEKSTLCHVHGMLQDREKFSELTTSRLGLTARPEFEKLYQSGLLQHIYIPDWMTLYLEKEHPVAVNAYEDLQGLAHIPYHMAPAPARVRELEAGFADEAVKVMMHVHGKMDKLAGHGHGPMVRDALEMYELESMDRNQLQQEYCMMQDKYVELLYSRAQNIDRRLKKYPSLNKFAENFYDVLARTRDRLNGQPAGSSQEDGQGVGYDLPYDTRWAQQDARFDRVLHIFFKETGGPRAAAGYLPGHKMCLPMSLVLEKTDYRYILERCANDRISTIVLHNIWYGTKDMIDVLRRELSPLRICAIWYANTTQFVDKAVRMTFVQLLKLKHDGIIDELATVKSGLETVSGEIFNKPMYSLPPRLERPAYSGEDTEKSVLIPLRDIWRKNFYTNLYAAGSLDELGTIYTNVLFTNYKEINLKPRVRQLGKFGMASRDEVFNNLATVGAVMNVTLSECQPLVFLESLAFRVPCLTGPIQLDILDDHPYRKLTEVSRADSLTAVSDALKKVLNLRWNSKEELNEMMEDYESRLYDAAINNYIEFFRP